MKKLLKILRRKRIQGAIVVGVTFLLDQLGIVSVEAQTAQTVNTVVQALGAIWGIYGMVDAAPGHGEV